MKGPDILEQKNFWITHTMYNTLNTQQKQYMELYIY